MPGSDVRPYGSSVTVNENVSHLSIKKFSRVILEVVGVKSSFSHFRNQSRGLSSESESVSGNFRRFRVIHPSTDLVKTVFFVYYESIKRELKIRPIFECRCDERLKTKAEESTLLSHTGLSINTRDISCVKQRS